MSGSFVIAARCSIVVVFICFVERSSPVTARVILLRQYHLNDGDVGRRIDVVDDVHSSYQYPSSPRAGHCSSMLHSGNSNGGVRSKQYILGPTSPQSCVVFISCYYSGVMRTHRSPEADKLLDDSVRGIMGSAKKEQWYIRMDDVVLSSRVGSGGFGVRIA